MRPDFQHRVLYHIFSIGAAAEKPKRNTECAVDVTFNQQSERASSL
jgi:hypothetical protein